MIYINRTMYAILVAICAVIWFFTFPIVIFVLSPLSALVEYIIKGKVKHGLPDGLIMNGCEFMFDTAPDFIKGLKPKE